MPSLEGIEILRLFPLDPFRGFLVEMTEPGRNEVSLELVVERELFFSQAGFLIREGEE